MQPYARMFLNELHQMRERFTIDRNLELHGMDLIKPYVKSTRTIIHEQTLTIPRIHENNNINNIKK